MEPTTCAHMNCGCGWSDRRAASDEAQALGPAERKRIRSALAARAGSPRPAAAGGSAPPVSDALGPADTVLVNGRIATLNPRQPFVSALAIRGGRIIASGSDAEIIGPNRGRAPGWSTSAGALRCRGSTTRTRISSVADSLIPTRCAGTA